MLDHVRPQQNASHGRDIELAMEGSTAPLLSAFDDVLLAMSDLDTRAGILVLASSRATLALPAMVSAIT